MNCFLVQACSAVISGEERRRYKSLSLAAPGRFPEAVAPCQHAGGSHEGRRCSGQAPGKTALPLPVRPLGEAVGARSAHHSGRGRSTELRVGPESGAFSYQGPCRARPPVSLNGTTGLTALLPRSSEMKVSDPWQEAGPRRHLDQSPAMGDPLLTH